MFDSKIHAQLAGNYPLLYGSGNSVVTAWNIRVNQPYGFPRHSFVLVVNHPPSSLSCSAIGPPNPYPLPLVG